jgi:hypothetical protein
MMRIQMIAPNFDSSASFASFGESSCKRLTSGSVCDHLAGIRIHDVQNVKRNFNIDAASNPSLHGSENGSVANMILHSTSRLTESLFPEGCPGKSRF